MTLLEHDEITARIKARRSEIEREEVTVESHPTTVTRTEPATVTSNRYVRPLTAVGDDLVGYFQSLEGRFELGLRPVDEMTRGIGRGELCYISGRPHSGKSQVMLNAVAHNPDKVIVLFTPDEVDQLVLLKLIAIRYGIPATEMEDGIRRRDPQYVSVVQAAANDYRNLVIVDEVMGFGPMREAIDEVRNVHGHVDAVFIDYLELVPYGGGDSQFAAIQAKTQEAKRWTKTLDIPVIALRQEKRGGSEKGTSGGMDQMQQGGEDTATFVLSVFRKRNSPKYAGDDSHRDTVTIDVAKNKRPPSITGEVDLYMDPLTGKIRPLVRGV